MAKDMPAVGSAAHKAMLLRGELEGAAQAAPSTKTPAPAKKPVSKKGVN
jgi:hypothetical protein